MNKMKANIEEIWLPITGYEGAYEVSSFGQVRSIRLEKGNARLGCQRKGGIIKPNKAQKYLAVCISKDKVRLTKTVHRLVAIAFIPNPKCKPQVNHIDGNKFNNHVSNLEWATPSENIKHSFALGLSKSPKGEKQGSSILKVESVVIIKTLLANGGLTYKQIGEQFGVKRSTIKDIKIGRTWSHVV